MEVSKDGAATGAASPAVHTGVSRTSRKKSQLTLEFIHDQQFDRGSKLVAAVHAWLARVKSNAPIGDEGGGNILSTGRNRQARRGRVSRATTGEHTREDPCRCCHEADCSGSSSSTGWYRRSYHHRTGTVASM